MKIEIEKEIERILPLMPVEPPKGTVELLKERGFLNDERLLYRIAYIEDPLSAKSVKMTRVKCSLCGGEDLLEYVPAPLCGRYGGGVFGFIDPADHEAKTSGNTCICPRCGAGMKAMHIGDLKSCKQIDSRICMSVHCIEGHLVMLSWVVKKMLHSDGSVRYYDNGYEGIAVIGKTLVRIKMYRKFMSSFSWLDHWEYTRKFSDELDKFSREEVVEAKESVVERSECAHSALAEYLNSDGKLAPGSYIRVWLKYPNAENLVRQGFSSYLSDVLDKADRYQGCDYHLRFDVRKTEKYIDWKQVRPSLMLGLEKDELDIARSSTVDCVEFYKEIKRNNGLRLTEKHLKIAKSFGYSAVSEMVFDGVHGHKPPIIHLLNYLQKQREGNQKGEKEMVGIQYLEDYWNSLYKVYGALPSELLYPSRLIRAHDEILLRVKENEDAEINRGIREQAERLEYLNYESKEHGMLIRVAQSHAELIKEGKILHHCVGNYAKAHARAETCILFIRRTEDPEMPFYTLEYKNGVVQQNRGLRNCARTPEVSAFEAEWLDHINKEKVYGRQSGNREEQYAGT